MFSFKTFSQSAGRYESSSPFTSYLIILKPTSNPDMTLSQDLPPFTGISMTERTGPSNSISCAYFAPQQVGWATSKSFQISCILVKDNMLQTTQIFHENPNQAYSYHVDCGNYHIAESSPEALSMARVLQILSQNKFGITTAHPFLTVSFGEVALFQFAESKPFTSRAANLWIPNVESLRKLLLAVR